VIVKQDVNVGVIRDFWVLIETFFNYKLNY